ncbi:MAG: hypothetical protein HOJ07_02150, partial [Rhodospirillaceae bacterium]|nr:hypothetical protein [Rhodospirillaceae bacterium]
AADGFFAFAFAFAVASGFLFAAAGFFEGLLSPFPRAIAAVSRNKS